jgi:hypothetical protein
VAGRLTGPVQGFGKLWQKTYSVDVGPDISPQDTIAVWKAHFPEFWPKGNRFAGALTGISPGDVALLDIAVGGGVKMSTGVFVLYADAESFTFATPQGHQFAGWITFSAERPGETTVVQAQGVLRAGDPARAERIARSITSRSHQASALASLAFVCADTDPERAGWLATYAEGAARSIVGARAKASALAALAHAIADTEPEYAERLAQSITTSMSDKASALASVARAIAGTDPARAERIVDDAEGAAGSITSGYERASALASVARAIAGTDPARAERIVTDAEGAARSISSAHAKASALAGLAVAIATTDPARAARLTADAVQVTLSVANDTDKESALVNLAQAMAAITRHAA